MAHLPEKEFDQIQKDLDEYNPQRYIIAFENQPYEHYHFLIQIDDPEKFYTRYRKKVFIDKYSLRGQAKKDLPRQYGKVKDIENLDKMASYTVKDENFRAYNIEQEEIDNIIDNAFNKSDKIKLLKDKMIEYVEEKLIKGGFSKYVEHQEIATHIIRFCFDNKIEIRRSLIDNYYYYFRQFTTKKDLQYSSHQMYNALYNNIIQ